MKTIITALTILSLAFTGVAYGDDDSGRTTSEACYDSQHLVIACMTNYAESIGEDTLNLSDDVESSDTCAGIADNAGLTTMYECMIDQYTVADCTDESVYLTIGTTATEACQP